MGRESGITPTEREILRVAGRVVSTAPEADAEQARYQVLYWLKNRAGLRLPRKAWQDHDSFELPQGGRNCTGVRVDLGGADMWAIRAEDPDKQVPGRIWTTEFVLAQERDCLLFSTRLLVHTREEWLDITPAVPGFMRQVAEKLHVECGSDRLSSEPFVIATDERFEACYEALLSRTRKLPYLVITVPQEAQVWDRPLLDARAMAGRMVGLARVVVMAADYTWELTRRLQRERSVFGGAARCYLPGFSATADPYAHRLVVASNLETDEGRARAEKWLGELAAEYSVRTLRRGRDVVAFSEVRDAAWRATQARLRRQGASADEKLRAAVRRIRELENELDRLRDENEYYLAEHEDATQRAESAEEQLRGARYRIKQLVERGQPGSNADVVDDDLPESWPDVAPWCSRALAGRLVLAPQARRNSRAPNFGDLAQVVRCLRWLADECRDQYLNGGGTTLREAQVEDGVRNSHCGNDAFEFDCQGQRYLADWHIKNGGNTRDPGRCLRIYYTWDDIEQVIIVADLPAHRRTDAT